SYYAATTRRSAPLEREAEAERDEDGTGDALEPRAHAMLREERREAREDIGVRGEPRDAHDRVRDREEQALPEDIARRIDELRQERQVEDRDLRIENVVQETLEERSRGAPAHGGVRRGVRAKGVSQRPDPEISEIYRPRELDDRERLRGGREDHGKPERRRGRVDEQPAADAQRRDQRGTASALERDLRDERHVRAGRDREEREDGEPGKNARLDHRRARSMRSRTCARASRSSGPPRSRSCSATTCRCSTVRFEPNFSFARTSVTARRMPRMFGSSWP